MYEIELKVKDGSDYKVMPVPAGTAERIQLLKEMIGKDAALRLTTRGVKFPGAGTDIEPVSTLIDTFIVGTTGLADTLQEIFKDAVILDFRSAYGLAQHAPWLLVDIMRCFTTKEEVSRYIEKEKEGVAVDLKQWWSN